MTPAISWCHFQVLKGQYRHGNSLPLDWHNHFDRREISRIPQDRQWEVLLQLHRVPHRQSQDPEERDLQVLQEPSFLDRVLTPYQDLLLHRLHANLLVLLPPVGFDLLDPHLLQSEH